VALIGARRVRLCCGHEFLRNIRPIPTLDTEVLIGVAALAGPVAYSQGVIVQHIDWELFDRIIVRAQFKLLEIDV